MQRLTNQREIEDARRRLSELLEDRAEWFCTERRGGRRVELRRGEWELRAAPRGLHFSFWGETGARVWRVVAWALEGEKLTLEAARRMGAERATLELVPRASVAEAVAVLAEARRKACERLASALCEELPGAKIERAGLSAGARRSEPGRYARIILRRAGACVAATGPVVPLGAEEADAFLSSALLWFGRVEEKSPRARMPTRLLLLASTKLAGAICERVALLRDGLRSVVSVYEVDEEARVLTPARVPELDELLNAAPPRLAFAARSESCEIVKRLVALAPDAIDVVRARRGETLRFHGLPFARVRRMLGREHVWFGAGRASRRRLLDESNWTELVKLLEELNEHRRAGATAHAHALYRDAPEAWLESLLRRDITRLDPGLRLAPLYAQFRTTRAAGAGGSRPVDLLALRRDGRLAVIELKVSEDAALPLQGADYWRRISTYQRAGHIERARLFGDASISDESPLVYLVAPMLRFHRAFDALARRIRPEIEMYRFDLNEDWRAGVSVARRTHIV